MNRHYYLILLFLVVTAHFALAQDKSPTSDDVADEVTGAAQSGDKSVVVADQVQVDPVNSDDEANLIG